MGLMPTMPQRAAGWRIEPPVSEPNDRGAKRAATAAAEPLDEPPVPLLELEPPPLLELEPLPLLELEPLLVEPPPCPEELARPMPLYPPTPWPSPPVAHEMARGMARMTERTI